MFKCLVLSGLLFEPASDCRKSSQGWGCVEKVVETKLSIKYIKNKKIKKSRANVNLM